MWKVVKKMAQNDALDVRKSTTAPKSVKHLIGGSTRNNAKNQKKKKEKDHPAMTIVSMLLDIVHHQRRHRLLVTSNYLKDLKPAMTVVVVLNLEKQIVMDQNLTTSKRCIETIQRSWN